MRASALVMAAALLVPSRLPAQDAAVPAHWIGTWEGSAEIVNKGIASCAPWVRLTIAADGTVQGMVGEARLVRGRVTRNRGAIGRALRLKTDWIIDATLDGPLLSSESVTRERIRIPFDVADGAMRGGFHASGGGVTISARFALRRTGG